MGTIKIEGMKFYAFHGHFDAEQIVGNQFEVDVKLKVDCTKAALTDQLENTLNYQSVYEIVKKQMEFTSRLLENVAQRILDAVYFEFPEIKKATVKIAKINPPMGGEIEKVSIKINR